MQVSEVFLSCQGEGLQAGIPQVFVRLQGCNVGCKWCDTKYAWDVSGGDYMSSLQVANTILKVADGRCKWVYVTGGEPLLQLDVGELVRYLRRLHNYSVTVATSGTVKLPSWYKDVCWVVDYKLPSSGAVKPHIVEWWKLRKSDELKFVVGSEEDLKEVESYRLSMKCYSGAPTLLVSPMLQIGSVEGQQKWLRRVWEFCCENNLRFSLQLHKLVYGNKKGV